MLEKFKEKYNLSFLEKLTQEPDIDIYVFGGAIRDIYLDREWKEIDARIVYNKSRDEREYKIEELFKDFDLEGKTQIEHLNLTVYRFLPQGSITDAEIDLSLVPTLNDNVPDFTINAVFFDLKKEKILDTYNGLSDLDKKLIKTVKEPNTQFKEEPHIMFRALKFACQLNFDIEESTLAAIHKNKSHVQDTFNLINAQKEGIFVELFLGNIFKGLKSDPLKYFTYLNQTGLFEEFVAFYANQSGLSIQSTHELQIKDLGSYEENISYLLSEVIHRLNTEEKNKQFHLLAESLSVSTPKKYTDFVIDTSKISYID